MGQKPRTSASAQNICPPLPAPRLAPAARNHRWARRTMPAQVRMDASVDGLLWTPSAKSGARDEMFGPLKDYCVDRNIVTRRPTRTVTCGPVKFGSDHPVVRQTMATTDTKDVKASIEQVHVEGWGGRRVGRTHERVIRLSQRYTPRCAFTLQHKTHTHTHTSPRMWISQRV